jgi:hypothetical protein
VTMGVRGNTIPPGTCSYYLAELCWQDPWGETVCESYVGCVDNGTGTCTGCN